MMIRRQVAADRRSQASEYVPRTPRWQAYSKAGHAVCWPGWAELGRATSAPTGVVVSCADDRY